MLDIIGKDTTSGFLIPDMWKRHVSKEELFSWLWYFKYHQFAIIRFLYWTNQGHFNIELEWNDPFPCNMDFDVFTSPGNWENLNQKYGPRSDHGDLVDYSNKITVLVKDKPYYLDWLYEFYNESSYIHLLNSPEDPFMISSIRKVIGSLFPFYIKRVPVADMELLPLKLSYLEFFKENGFTSRQIKETLTEITYHAHKYLHFPDANLEDRWRSIMIETLLWCSNNLTKIIL
jgi:hypothetical protein